MSACTALMAALVLLCGADEPDQGWDPDPTPTATTERPGASPPPSAPYASWEAWRSAPIRARTPRAEPWREAELLDRAAANAALRASYAAGEVRALAALSEIARGEPDEPTPTTEQTPLEPDEPDLEVAEDSEPTHSGRSVWDDLADCESGNWIDGGASFETGSARWWWGHPDKQLPPWGTSLHHGGLQFHPDTWSWLRSDHHPQYAYNATREQQIEVAERVLAAQGWGAWPTCARKLGLR